jgi:hypothetical protein
VFREDDLVISDYAVGDVVKVQAFGKTTRRIIEKVSLGDKGEFVYEIANLEIRKEDITGIVARGYKSIEKLATWSSDWEGKTGER